MYHIAGEGNCMDIKESKFLHRHNMNETLVAKRGAHLGKAGLN